MAVIIISVMFLLFLNDVLYVLILTFKRGVNCASLWLECDHVFSVYDALFSQGCRQYSLGIMDLKLVTVPAIETACFV